MDEAERRIREQVSDANQHRLEAMAWGAMAMATNVEPTPQKPLTMRDMNEAVNKCRVMMKDRITFRAFSGHEGPVLKVDGPDGQIFELSFQQAQEIHQKWPMKLVEIVDEHTADFSPLIGWFNEFAPMVLPLPPFDVTK